MAAWHRVAKQRSTIWCVVGKFADDVKGFDVDTVKKMELVARLVLLRVYSEIIKKSPVLSGRFRSNWAVAIGSIPSGTDDSDTFPEGDVVGSDTGPIISAKVSEGEATLFGLNAGDTIYMANNLPYAQVLENGRTTSSGSIQAPNGMVGLTVQEFQEFVNEIALKVSYT